ncbi:MAG: lipase family protein [Crocinitomicaceae bacterium]
MKTIILPLLLLIGTGISHAQNLVSVTFLENSTISSLDLFPQVVPDYDVDYYKIVYTTTDVDGNSTIASGGLAVPLNTPCDSLPIGVYQHGTSLNKEEVPSRNNGEAIIAKLMSSKGFVTCAPDYLGMGDSPGLHPYVHAESEATAALDMIRAVRLFLSDSLSIVDNGEVVITGYSQGGHAAMATHKYVEDNNLLAEFNIVASAPASGPYDLSGDQSELLLSNDPYTNPGYVVYLLSSFELAYGNIYTTYSDILKSPYDAVVPPYFDGNNTTYGMGDLNPLLPTQLSDLIQDSVLTNFLNDTLNHPLWIALRDNDNHNWVPTRPVQMFYCTNDEQVDFNNALTAESYMNSNGATDVTSMDMGALDHGNCVLPALSTALAWMSSKVNSCAVLNTLELETLGISIYPNPTDHQMHIDGLQPGTEVRVLDAAGKQVHQTSTQDLTLTINTTDWDAGWYVVQIEDALGRMQVRKLAIAH